MKPERAADSIRAYASRAALVLIEARGSADQIRRFGGVADVLTGPDSRRRWDECLAALAAEDAGAQFLPPPQRVAEATIHEEERHSLVLSWLLDPSRSGDLARSFWSAFRAVAQTAATSQAERLQDAKQAFLDWPKTHPEPWLVQPARYKAEKHKFDVFGRDVDHEDASPRSFAILIENKVRSETAEQDGQLDTYYARIGEKYGAATHQKTAFIFLCERQREPRKAAEYGDRWLRLGWADIDRALVSMIRQASLSHTERLWVRQYRDSIREEILGLPSRAMVQETLAAIRPRVTGKRAQDPAWRERHEDIVRLWRTVVGGR
jgi:hypothetical protein